MKFRTVAVILFCALTFNAAREVRAQSYAALVEAYFAGDGAAAGFDDTNAVLGAPTRLTGVGVFPGVVSAFNPPYLPSEIVSIGEGGFLKLRLANFLLPSTPGRDLGVFVNIGLIDNDYPNGVAANPLNAGSGTFGVNSAILEVSATGEEWISLGSQLFDVPTIGYSDVTNPFAETAGNSPSDFGLPFEGTLGELAGLSYHDASAPDILESFGDTGGGNWFDLSATGLSKVGWLRISVPDDGNPNTHLKFELDAVSVASAAVGPAVPEPSTMVVGLIGIAALLAHARRLGR